jgi:hypothetical protein
MIGFGSSISDAEAYRRYAEPGVELAKEADSVVFAFSGVSPAGRSGNLLLDAAARYPDLEALVLLQPHVEITDQDLCAKIRQSLSDPDVAVLGAAGSTGGRSIAWWEGDVSAAPLSHAYMEHGTGELPAFSWTKRTPPPADVEVVDEQLVVLSPWAVRNVRFNEALVLNRGFVLDYCRQVRGHGRKVRVADLRATLHQSIELVDNLDLWTEAHIRFAETSSQITGESLDEQGWKRRTRRAEAEREAARAFAFSKLLNLDAHVLALERELAAKTDTLSWRLTAPLRAVNHLRRQVLARQDRADRS